MKLENKLEQKQTLSLRQIQSLKILELTTLELKSQFEREYQENPCLEQEGCMEEVADTAFAYGTGAAPHKDSASDEPPPEAGEQAEEDENQLERLVLEQLNAADFSPAEWRALKYMVACLDANGRFKTPLSLVAASNRILLEQASHLLERLQTLEPAGIFARDLQHCLQLQLQRQPKPDPVACRLVQECLPLLAANKSSAIARQLGVSVGEVRAAVATIRRLNPRPTAGLGGGQIAYVRPDVVAEYEDGRWQITIRDAWRERYHLNESYVKMAQTADTDEMKQYFSQKLQAARFLMETAQKRHDTLLEITRLTLARQGDFLRGQGELSPFSMTEVAEQLQVNVSTVSRALRDKYLQGPHFVVPFRDLFGAVVLKSAPATDGQVTAAAIRRQLLQLTRAEDAAHPYSDQKLCELLSAQGMQVGRRTIAKYRAELNIPDSRERQVRK